MTRILLRRLGPWVITVTALFLAFRGIEWEQLWGHLKNARLEYIFLATVLTALSYWLRAVRWPMLFPSVTFPILSAWKVLVLGFFMNNILPARAGELVRAHLGGKVLRKPGTLVLATIASERLADGLTLSVFFAVIVGVFGRGSLDSTTTNNFLYVSYFFAAVAVAVLVALSAQRLIIALTEKIAARFDTKASAYAMSRIHIFLDGLSPLRTPRKAFQIACWSIIIWGIELLAFDVICLSFNCALPLTAVVIFLVAVNFSSLIPAAPGGFGVIELIAKSVLISIGVQSGELALSMVLAQHIIQYVVIGTPGVFLLSTLRSQLADMQLDDPTHSTEGAIA